MERVDIQGGGDDACVFKSDFSLGRIINSFNVRVNNCTFGTRGATALEIGSETVGDFYDYRLTNTHLVASGDAAIGMAIMDGARVSNFHYENISISNCNSPIQFYVGARGSHPAAVGRKVGSIQNALI